MLKWWYKRTEGGVIEYTFGFGKKQLAKNEIQNEQVAPRKNHRPEVNADKRFKRFEHRHPPFCSFLSFPVPDLCSIRHHGRFCRIQL